MTTRRFAAPVRLRSGQTLFADDNLDGYGKYNCTSNYNYNYNCKSKDNRRSLRQAQGRLFDSLRSLRMTLFWVRLGFDEGYGESVVAFAAYGLDCGGVEARMAA